MPNSPSRVRVRVPAKINLALAVGDRRPDGFHDLRTVFHAVDLYDVVTATRSEALSVSCTVEGVPTDDTNLAWRAARAVDGEAGVALHIDKTIPVAGGMAGGSADAAATLVACDRLWGAGLDAEALHERATGLGSDVPFALVGGTAIGSGRGERLQPIAAPELHWVLVPAAAAITAGAAYARLDELRADGTSERADVDAVVTALADQDLTALAAALANDLQAAAVSLYPPLADTLAAVEAAGALRALVSGSGPTVVGLARDAGHAQDLAASLTAGGRPARTARGPVPGATVID